jgi:hypothetical protein
LSVTDPSGKAILIAFSRRISEFLSILVSVMFEPHVQAFRVLIGVLQKSSDRPQAAARRRIRKFSESFRFVSHHTYSHDNTNRISYQ